MEETSFMTSHEPPKSTAELRKEQKKTLSDRKQSNNNFGKEGKSENIADRLSNIESRLTDLEISISNNFSQLISHIKNKD